MSNNKRKRDNEESQAQDDGHQKEKKRRKGEHKPTAEVNGIPSNTGESQAQKDGRRKEKKRREQEDTATADISAIQSNTKESQAQDRGHRKEKKRRKGDDKTTADISAVLGDIKESQAPDDGRHKEKKRRKSEHKPTADANGVPGGTDAAKKQAISNDDSTAGLSKAMSNEQGAKSSERKRKRRKHGEKRDDPRSLRNKERMAVDAQRKREKKRHRDKVSRKDSVAATEHKRNLKQHKDEESEQKPLKRKDWRLSKAIGGRMLSIDPLFSPEEDYILIAYDHSVCIYAISTSLLLRRLNVKAAEPVSSFALSPTDNSHLFISSTSGVIEKWDWKSGVLLHSWNTKTSIHFIATMEVKSTELGRGLVYSIDSFEGRRWSITIHKLMTRDDADKTDLGTLLRSEDPFTSLRILEEGRIIIATAGLKVFVGTTDNPTPPALKDISYVWWEIECTEWITCIDTRIRQDLESQGNTKNPVKGMVAAVDIVIGGLKGAMFIYEDILRRLKSKGSSKKTGTEDSLLPRKLHWHRNAVASVKWSADGNYVISGGQETVLIIWQLETGHKQELPHLSAPIENIVVSPAGCSYAIHLADNSAMILSTTELQPIFSVAGIQIPAIDRIDDKHTPFVPTVDAPTEDALTKQNQRFPTVSSSKANQLLVAVPAYTASAVSSNNACFLQTVDIQSEQQLHRQALARNKVTTLNMGPEANTIDEPNVTHMQVSDDGQWLVTVDEWIPPMRDIGHLAFDHQRAIQEQSLRKEVYLKFWAWGEVESIWELVSRIDNPQPTTVGVPGSIVDLAADPSRLGFATIGTDGIVRMWTPQIRKRHGLDIRGKGGKSLTSWSCQWLIQMPPALTATEASQSMKLAFSPDGSVLAVGISSMTSAVHFIDTNSRLLHASLTNLFEGPLYGFGIIDRYLITLSKKLQVWDIVTQELFYGFPIVSEPKDLGLEKRTLHTHLAIDQKHNIFAIAVPEAGQDKQKKTKLMSRVSIFDIGSSDPLYTHLLPNPTTSLLPAAGKKGFYHIDNAAEIRTLLPKQTTPAILPPPSSQQDPVPARGLANIYGDGKKKDDKEKREVLKLTSGNLVEQRARDDDMRVVSPEKLAEVFEASSAFALPPMMEMFERVAFLFAGRNGP